MRGKKGKTGGQRARAAAIGLGGAALLFLCAGAPRAEIERTASLGDKAILVYWWPKLAVPEGWHHDRAESMSNGFNALAPDGSDFAGAETVMYANALHKPREPDLKTLESVVENDRKAFVEKNATLEVRDAEPIVSGDGHAMKSLVFAPRGKGNWERVTYGEEGEYYLIFVLSSRTEQGYERALKAYREMLGRYREKAP
jgi:hypothetical protein